MAIYRLALPPASADNNAKFAATFSAPEARSAVCTKVKVTNATQVNIAGVNDRVSPPRQSSLSAWT